MLRIGRVAELVVVVVVGVVVVVVVIAVTGCLSKPRPEPSMQPQRHAVREGVAAVGGLSTSMVSFPS